MPGRADGGPSVVIPAYQAAATLRRVVEATRRAVPGARVYVVDDGSTDGTADAGREAGVTLLAHPVNRGKGAALATGIARALADGADVVVTLDADEQHPPAFVPALVEPLGTGAADLV